MGTSHIESCKDLHLNWAKNSTRVLGIQICKDIDNTVKINYQGVIDKLKNKLKIWAMRRLSLIGKITIIKVLGISQLVFLLNMLPSPPKEILKEIENVIFKFLWNNSKDRIKRKTIIGPLDMGGLNMTDINKFNTAVKISWISRLLNDTGNWCKYVTNKCPINSDVHDLEYLFKCNLNVNDIHKQIPVAESHIWHEILDHWATYHYTRCDKIIDTMDILSQKLWFNSDIKCKGDIIFKNTWYRKGVKTVGNLYNINKWYNVEEFRLKYDLQVNFLEYMGVLLSIPTAWRRHLKLPVNVVGNIDIEPVPLAKLDHLLSTKTPVKLIYKELVLNSCEPPEGRFDQWCTNLNVNLNDTEWMEQFTKGYYLSISSIIRSFNYRFLTRDVLTNNRLFRMGISETDKCYICGEHVETIEHLYWECVPIRILWEGIRNLLYNRLEYELPMTPSVTLLGILDNNNHVILEEIPTIGRMSLLITRWYIHNSKCNNSKPNIKGLVGKISEIELMERNIASSKGEQSLDKHIKKWLDLRDITIEDTL